MSSAKNWQLKPHELTQILGWRIEKVFRQLAEGRIPGHRLEQGGKVRFFCSPSAIREWLQEKRICISPTGRKLLSNKLAEEREHLNGLAYGKMVRTSAQADERYRNLQRLRQEQERLFAFLKHAAA